MRNILVAPASPGSVRLSSANPLNPLLLHPELFTNPLDEKLVYECTRMTTTAIQNSSAVSKYGTIEYAIDDDMRGGRSNQALRKRLLETVETVSHPSVTCAMGAVVDT